MILLEQLTQIGSFYKPHGIKGEISAGFDYDIDPDSLRCVIIEVDGIFVPFFIESWRTRGPGRFLVKLEGIDDESQASTLAKKSLYAISDELDIEDDSDGIYLSDLIGFDFYEGEIKVGVVKDVDDSTENILIIVEDANGKPVYIPYAEDWIENVDIEGKTIEMTLPEGIIDLNA